MSANNNPSTFVEKNNNSTGPLQAIALAFKYTFRWSGRASRPAFWWVYAFMYLTILPVLFINTEDVSGIAMIYLLACILWSLVLIIPILSLTVRRLHDRNMSGWWYFISLLPLVGPIVLIVLLLLPGVNQDNRYGPDPEGGVSDGWSKIPSQDNSVQKAASWYQDPNNNQLLRYWDGHKWTDDTRQVAISTPVAQQPVAPVPVAPVPVAQPPVAPVPVAQPPVAQPPVAKPTVAPVPAANWYTDPSGEARLRYWDGQKWTDQTAN